MNRFCLLIALPEEIGEDELLEYVSNICESELYSSIIAIFVYTTKPLNQSIRHNVTFISHLRDALYLSNGYRSHLFIITLNIGIPAGILTSLQEGLLFDPMIGCCQPRYAYADSGQVVGWPSDGSVLVERDVLLRLDRYIITPELPSVACLISKTVVSALYRHTFPDDSKEALLALHFQMRQRGFRNLVDNRLFALVGPKDDPYMSTQSTCHEIKPRIQVEKLVDCTTFKKLPVLVDCRGMSAYHNGTSVHALGVLSGLNSIDSGGFEIFVIAPAVVISFHKLIESFPNLTIIPEFGDRVFASGIRLNQPWCLNDIGDLHRHCLSIGFIMLDTIFWDLTYDTNPEIYMTWKAIASLSNALFYISKYTQSRFIFRFPVKDHIRQGVIYPSSDISNYLGPSTAPSVSDYILIFGNSYPHKDVQSTLAAVLDAFPYQKIVVIGGHPIDHNSVVHFPSGSLLSEHIRGFVKDSKCIIYPSFYEGFGLPVVEGCAHNKIIFVRSSDLWVETASLLPTPCMIPFEDYRDLILKLKRFLSGEPCDYIISSKYSPVSWRDNGEAILKWMTESSLESTAAERWLLRNEQLFHRGVI